MADGAAAIEFDGVEFYVAADGGERRKLLDGITLTLQAGSTTALLGRSGSGKTTLLRMANRLLEPSSGRVLIGGRATTEWDAIELRRGIGYVIQETGLFPHFNIERNTGIVLEIEGKPKAEISRRVKEVLALVGMDAAMFGGRYPHQLSGGQRQRVGIARALAAEPRILLLDEPFGALDPITRVELQTMLRELLQRMKKTVVLVSHDLEEALYLAERIVLLEAGKIVADVPVGEFLKSDVAAVQEYVRAFRREAKTA